MVAFRVSVALVALRPIGVKAVYMRNLFKSAR